MDKIECEDFSLSPFIAVKGKDQSVPSTGVQMGIIWKCYVSDPQAGIDLELLIDDRSGKMLSFGFNRYGEKSGGGRGISK